jgi:pyruvate formate lyase activating enzyme
MKLGGLQKTSLIDYPDHICAIVWTVGCNFRCPFCYNPQLVTGNAELISEKDFFSLLEKRQGVLEAVSITGGEPFLQKDLKDFVKKIKKMGYLVKVDTNGTFPEKLEGFLDEKLIDYIAMDVKAPKNKYHEISGVKTDVSKIEKSIRIIKEKVPNYEFRTTFIPNLLKKNDIIEIAKWLNGAKNYYIQQFRNNEKLVESGFQKNKPYSEKYLEETLKEVKPFFDSCKIRGN